ncbi:hypothetical protein ATE84_4467 [Aquimarina sp. MAR_2010_214]|uniref:sensor histidine kinase n=1 Tax=Aquimarina sp. MAR_2010_214 TaxID=1250026 RepID=UPI000C704F6B|nr:sensor histidine kinase [Aquimarina sp. MAR_2010_214]PKV52355.1 hypothetical protein ATE84_4467 [Aquimarina sp. MAR_2010_214]
MSKILILILFTFLSLEDSFSQKDNTLRKAIFHLDNYQLKELENSINEIQSTKIKSLINWQFSFLENGNPKILDLKTLTNKIPEIEVLLNITKGDQEFLKSQNNDTISYKYYLNALNTSLKNKDSLLICFSTKKILWSIYYNRKIQNLYPRYLKILNQYAYNKNEKALFHFFNITEKTGRLKKEHIFEYKNILSIAQKSKNPFIEAKIYQMIGIQYSYFKEEKDSAKIYYKKAYEVIKKNPYAYAKNETFGIYTNTGILYNSKGRSNIANQYFHQALKVPLTGKSFLKKAKLSSLLSENYRLLKEYDSAFFYNHLSRKYYDSLKEYQNAIALNDIEIKYETAEKEKEIVQLLNTNLKTEASRVQNRNLLIGSLSLILVGSIFVFLIYKNTKRKQRIAEQEREIQIQKTEKLLKEQELTAIDAMISGQEKERQRLANELHDNLGSTLATVKLHFQHLQRNKDNPKVEQVEELYTKTNALLDEAYQKVRTIAHEKNSGVMANQGLLPAIKNLAKQVSNGDGLHIEVQDYGLEERLDNALEISIFRMIQELITNTIKHAEASETHISLTNHDSLLNIIIEDNGKGFDAKILPKKEGMGLRNIEKRVEHLEGTFEIDSTIGIGTNIIINIPI